MQDSTFIPVKFNLVGSSPVFSLLRSFLNPDSLVQSINGPSYLLALSPANLMTLLPQPVVNKNVRQDTGLDWALRYPGDFPHIQTDVTPLVNSQGICLFTKASWSFSTDIVRLLSVTLEIFLALRSYLPSLSPPRHLFSHNFRGLDFRQCPLPHDSKLQDLPGSILAILYPSEQQALSESAIPSITLHLWRVLYLQLCSGLPCL